MSVSSHEGYTFHDMATADMEEVAAQFFLAGGTRNGKQRGGVSFARKLHGDGAVIKSQVRDQLLRFYDQLKWPSCLRFLTMPGHTFNFERQLLDRRGLRPDCRCPYAKVRIICVENDPLIYRASLNNLPGMRRMQMRGPRALRTRLIAGYFMMNVEDYITDPNCEFFDAAWLDFTGPLTQSRLNAIVHFWNYRCGLHLTVTSMTARWPKGFSSKVHRHGGVTPLLLAELKDSSVLDEHHYVDPVPMHQITLTRVNPSLRYFGYDPKPWETIKHLLQGPNHLEKTS